MTVTLLAGHLKPFDVGKWISVDRGGYWETFRLAGAGFHGADVALLSAGNDMKMVGLYEYIQITADTADGTMPKHLEGARPVDPRITHGDLNMQ